MITYILYLFIVIFAALSAFCFFWKEGHLGVFFSMLAATCVFAILLTRDIIGYRIFVIVIMTAVTTSTLVLAQKKTDE